MKVVFVSNFFNHHQKPLSDALSRLTDEYSFIETSAVPQDRLALGYRTLSEEYVLPVRSESEKALAMKRIGSADVVIIGSAPEAYIRDRLKHNQLVFRYAERPLKTFDDGWKNPVRRIRWRKRNPVKKPIYLLCASAYAPWDFAKFGLFKSKAFRWGYFPETKRYPDVGSLIAEKRRSSLLWVGRFLHWKHPETAVKIAAVLKEKGYDFTLDMIGDGEDVPRIRQMICEYGLEDQVRLLGPLPYTKVREHMERTEIFLFTSDRREGWGAVLNEAMNSACAVVASSEIGSVPYLIEDGKDGLIYNPQDIDAPAEKVCYYLSNARERQEIASRAYRKIIDTWNAESAAKRLIELSKNLIDGKDTGALYEDGPCSTAPILKDR